MKKIRLTKAQEAKLSRCLTLNYTIVLRRSDEDGVVIARIEELEGCATHGDTEEEALRHLAEAKLLWLQDAVSTGDPIPEPNNEEMPSGKWIQRVPRSLHKRIAEMAKSEGVSLNQFVTSILAGGVRYNPAIARLQAQQGCVTTAGLAYIATATYTVKPDGTSDYAGMPAP